MMTNLWIISNELLFIMQVTSAFDPDTQFSRRRSALEQLNLIESELLDAKQNSENDSRNGETTMQWDANLVEGDMALNDEQIDILLDDVKEQLRQKRLGQHLKTRQRRTIVRESVHKWEQFPIPIIINEESGVDAAVIKGALQMWEENTCVRFKELPTAPHGKPYIEFKIGKGCSSNVGRFSGERQRISMNSNCSSLGMVTHLIGHSLGLFHEQARYDRDIYVNIVKENIIFGYTNQFSKRTRQVMETYAVPYDYGSIMHFNQTYFSRNGLNTIEPADRNYRYTIGQRTKLTFSDAKKVNLAYCKDACQEELKCMHDGYMDPKNCSRCRCPEVFGGDFCEKARKTTSAICAAHRDLTCSEKKQTIELNGCGECHYVIKALPGRVVELDVVKFEFKEHIPCEQEYLEVRYGRHLSVTGARFCILKPDRIISLTDTMAVSYRGSDKSHVTLSFRCGASFLASTDSGSKDSSLPTVSSSSSSSQTETEAEVLEKKIQTKNASYISTETVIKTLEETRTTAKKKDPNKIVIPELLVDEYFPNKSDTLLEHEVNREDEWTSWSSCTANCGGCGTQQRNKTLPYLTVQSRYCNTRMCENTGCCLPFTYVYNGTCLRPFTGSDNNTTGCEKQQAKSTTATTTAPCVQSKNVRCAVVEEEKQELVILKSQSSGADVASSIDDGNKQSVSNNNNYDSNNKNDNNKKGKNDVQQHFLDEKARLELLERRPALKRRLLAAQGRIRKVVIPRPERNQLEWRQHQQEEEALAENVDDYGSEGSGDNDTIAGTIQKDSYFYEESLHL